MTITPLVLLLATACGAPQAQEDVRAPPRIAQVRTRTLQPETWTQTIRTFGVFEAAEGVGLAVDFSASVKRVNFREGGQVTAGQTLLELDRGKRELLVNRAVRSVENVKAQLDRARQDLQRNEDLFAVDAITARTTTVRDRRSAASPPSTARLWRPSTWPNATSARRRLRARSPDAWYDAASSRVRP